jgi:predicted Zn-dependent peptidase
MILWAFILLAAFGSVPLPAQKMPKDKFVYPPLAKIQIPDVREAKLKNGMILYLIEDHDYPTIDMRAMVRTGSVYEPADKTGLADVTGTVMRTGGTSRYPGDELDRLLETLGATVETGIGQTSGYVTVSLLKEDVDKGLDILAGLLSDPAFPDEKIELAKIEQKSVISRRNDDIATIADREFTKLIYGAKNPYARHPEYATIDAITRDDLTAFHKRFFHPNNVILAAWGDFSAKDMEKKIEKAFAAWKPSADPVPPAPKVDYQYDFSVNHIQKTDVNQSHVLLGHAGTRMDNPDYPALQIMNQILSWERMFKKVRTQEGLAYSVWGYYGAGYDHEGVFSSGCQTKSESTAKAVRIMLEQIRKLQNEEVTDEELKRAKDSYLNSFVFNFDSKSKIVARLMTYAYYGYPRNFMDREKEAVEKVGKADILRVAKAYLKPDQVRILVVGRQEDFDEPLSNLGPVRSIDIAIPEPKQAAPAASAETLEKGSLLFGKAMEALGGVEALKSIRNTKASLQIVQVTPMGEMNVSGDLIIAYPDRFKLAMNTQFGSITMAVDGGEGWMLVPGQPQAMPMQEAQVKDLLAGLRRDPVNLVQAADLKVQYIGPGKLGEKDVEDLLITSGDYQFHLFIDPVTYLQAGSSYMGETMQGPAEKQDVVSGYQPVSGVQFATKSVTLSGGQKESDTTFSKIQLNAELDPKEFQKP